jgi:ABC-type transporter Mla subunit MlaD
VKRLLACAAIVLAAGAFLVVAGGASNGGAQGTYKIELDNAFGLVTGADFKVAGVPAGTITAINLDQKTLHAVVTVKVTQGGFGQFHQDTTCQTRPQSLIGEYFIDCNPGANGPVLKPGSTIPVSHTLSTIPLRPAAGHHAPAVSRAVCADHQRAGRGRGGAFGRPSGGPAPRRSRTVGDRQPAQPAGQRLEDPAGSDD